MASPADMFAAAQRPAQPPQGWGAGLEWDGESGTVTTPPVAGEGTPEFDAVLREHGLDPALVEVVGPMRMSRWQKHDGEWLTAYRFRFQGRRESVDLPALYAESRRKPRKALSGPRSPSTTVVAFADPQVGKVGSRGGTPELIERLAQTRVRLDAHLRARKPESTVFLDVGDGIEGFESGGNPMFTNDLSLPEQMDMYGVEVYKYLETMARYGHVQVAAVPSNHAAWRNGKQTLGKPADDFGLHVHRQVERLAHASGIDADWHYPEPYDESVALDVRGTRLGLVHGNQFGPGGAVNWWQAQTFGAQAVADVDLLVFGHYHHFSATVAGRNSRTKQQRWCLGSPTLDNGSDWYRQRAGRDSDTGLLVFDVTDDGFNLSSLTIL